MSEYDIDDWKLVYICTYKGEHFFKIPIDEHHFIPIAIGAGCAHIIRDVSMFEIYNICKKLGIEDKYYNASNSGEMFKTDLIKQSCPDSE